MQTHVQRWIVVVASISLGAGVALSHVIEPGVRVEKIRLTSRLEFGSGAVAMRYEPRR
jgi:hypothetical protein